MQGHALGSKRRNRPPGRGDMQIEAVGEAVPAQRPPAGVEEQKLALPSSRYYLLCEWLDMTPISTAVTAIEEVVVLRKARRLAANVRRKFSTATGRAANRVEIARFLEDNPLAPGTFQRFLSHLGHLLDGEGEDQRKVLDRGWF